MNRIALAAAIARAIEKFGLELLEVDGVAVMAHPDRDLFMVQLVPKDKAK